MERTGKSEKQIEWAITIATLVMGGLIYGLAGFTYVHANFLTRAEAETRKGARDKTDELIFKSLERMEQKLDRIIDAKIK